MSAEMTGLRVIEVGSFVAAPFAGLTLAQMGAEVIRVDPPGGASDFKRWPLAQSGASLFWSNLNKGKKSVVIDFRRPEGRELLKSLIVAPGSSAGIVIDNLVGRSRVEHDELAALRSDVISAHVEGRADGRPAVDYTINAEVGLPLMTGPAEVQSPINHVLPAWDLLTGMTVAMSVLAATRNREATGQGARLEIALADVALAGIGTLGWLAEADLAGRARPRHGNHMFGSFGVDFQTSDGRRVMVVALTEGQWRALCRVTQTVELFAELEKVLQADLQQEADRYRLRETIAAILGPWFEGREFGTVCRLLDEAHVLWSPYRDTAEVAALAKSDPLGIADVVDQPGIGPMLATGRPLRWDGKKVGPSVSSALGADTTEVLAEVLSLSRSDIHRLIDDEIVALPDASELLA